MFKLKQEGYLLKQFKIMTLLLLLRMNPLFLRFYCSLIVQLGYLQYANKYFNNTILV